MNSITLKLQRTRKLFLMAVLFFGSINAQDDNSDEYYSDVEYAYEDSEEEYEGDDNYIDLAIEELIYEMGMNLAEQDLIVDGITAKQALLSLYQNVEEVTQIVDLFMMIDDEIAALDITTIDELFEYELHNHSDMVQACVAWLTAYQNMFIIFQSIHADDSSFEVWCQDMLYFGALADDEQPTDPDYLELWQAGVAVLQAQDDFEDALADIE
jgi:hypothetical protein